MASIGTYDMSYRVNCCNNCGFLFAGELPSSAQYITYYEHLSKYDQIDDVAQISKVDIARAETTVSIVERYISKNQGIADLGCGVGHLLHAFNKAGWKTLFGIDPAPLASQRAQELFGLEGVGCGIITDAAAQLPLANVDLVCLTGVLEHLWSPLDDLEYIFSNLEPGKYVFIEVPALELFNRPSFEPYGEFSLEHIQYFSMQSLRKLMAAAGARSICIELLELSPTQTGSILGLFQICDGSEKCALISDEHNATEHNATDLDMINAYLVSSSKHLDRALVTLAATQGPWILYGAGSHTARLLPILAERGLDKRILAIVDGNDNLHGKKIGHWVVDSPALLNDRPMDTVVISSYRAQSAIKSLISKRYSNPVVCLYDL